MKRIIIVAISSLAFTVCFGQKVQRIKITDLEKTIRESRTPMIVNFWATFCLPCIEEIPYFQEMAKKYEKDSIKLLLVSLDLKEDFTKIQPFAAKRKFNAPIAWLDESNADYFIPKVDSTWSGAIPATLFINNKTTYRKFFEQEFSREQLEKQILEVLGKN
ncbi:MAG: TlpA family protein disulfide reductase [Chitinophagaceae bacterium]|nr:TlpA family protein disulfide reductase [Chitinophagaceae bacterium]